jgi:hypothetical protein
MGGWTKKNGGGQPNYDQYDDTVKKVRQAMPNEPKGTAVVTRFLNEAKGTRISVLFFDDTSPIYKDKLKGHVIQAKATSDGKTIATISFLLRSFAPGRYECDGGNTVVGAAISDTWDPSAPGTYWSMNPNGQCELELHDGPNGDIEGTFRGKLVTNDANGYLLVENGYLYVKRFEGMGSGGGDGGGGMNGGSM